MTVRGLRHPEISACRRRSMSAGALQEHWRTIAVQAWFTLSAAAFGLDDQHGAGDQPGAMAFTDEPEIRADRALPVVLVFRSTPIAAVAPIMMLIFGRGMSTSMAVVSVVSFFPMLVNMMRGLQICADRNAAELLYVYGAVALAATCGWCGFPMPCRTCSPDCASAGSSAILGRCFRNGSPGSKGLGNLILESGELRETELLWAAVLTSVAVALYRVLVHVGSREAAAALDPGVEAPHAHSLRNRCRAPDRARGRGRGHARTPTAVHATGVDACARPPRPRAQRRPRAGVLLLAGHSDGASFAMKANMHVYPDPGSRQRLAASMMLLLGRGAMRAGGHDRDHAVQQPTGPPPDLRPRPMRWRRRVRRLALFGAGKIAPAAIRYLGLVRSFEAIDIVGKGSERAASLAASIRQAAAVFKCRCSRLGQS